MNAFDAPAGSVWSYVKLSTSEERFVLVLSEHDTLSNERPGVMFRQFMNLETGKVDWFSDDSDFNRCARRIA